MNVFELIKEKLEEMKSESADMEITPATYYEEGLDKAISIVDEVAQEYNNGWISCSERLPDKVGKYIVAVKNLTGYWIMENNVFVCDYIFDEFIFQGWEDNEVTHWQPLPTFKKLYGRG